VKRLILLCACVLIPSQALTWSYPVGSTDIGVNGYLEGLGVYALDNDTAKEDPSALLSLTAKADFATWGAFKLTLKGDYDGKIHDPSHDRVFAPIEKVYRDNTPALTLDEAYLDLFTGKADLRIGLQKFAWGRLDEFNPTDNLNTEDMTDPVLREESERKQGALAVKADIYTDIINCELAWIPRYLPYRLPMPDERWFPPVLKVPDAIETNSVFGSVPVTATYADIDLPAFTLDNSEAGVRLSRSIAGCELSVSYFNGYDNMPVIAVPTELVVELTDPAALKTSIQGNLTAKPQLKRMQVYGLDFSTTLGGFTIRGEGAYFKDKYYVRTAESIYPEIITTKLQQELMEEFLNTFYATGQTRQSFHLDPAVAIKKDALKYGLGIDYVRGDATISAQIIEERVLDYDDDKPIYFIKGGYDTMLSLAYKQFFLQNTLELNLGGAYDYTFHHYLFQPSAVYGFTDAIRATLGVVIIAGKDPNSLLGQFRDNDEVFVKLRYSF